jgi:basic membrane lipoprotein Med (substrate-binding protein (PBP1-ABC) superfamily)
MNVSPVTVANSPATTRRVRLAMVTDSGGHGDRSFNDYEYRRLTDADVAP